MARVDDTSDPLGHAAGWAGSESDLDEARLMAGEAESSEFDDDATELEDESVAERDLDDDRGGSDRGRSRGRRGGGGGGGSGPEDPDEDLHPAPRPARHRNRLIAFVQGSWRELQRVQWPDQRQVMQATGVVIGFVIVAGAWLGLADWVSTKIVNFLF